MSDLPKTLPKDFRLAYQTARRLKGGMPTEQLELYGLAKIAIGKDIKDEKPLGMMERMGGGKLKRDAWQKLVNEGVSQEDAQKRYVKHFETLKEKYGLRDADAKEKQAEDEIEAEA